MQYSSAYLVETLELCGFQRILNVNSYAPDRFARL